MVQKTTAVSQEAEPNLTHPLFQQNNRRAEDGMLTWDRPDFHQTNMQIGGTGKGKEATDNETKVDFMCLQDGPRAKS